MLVEWLASFVDRLADTFHAGLFEVHGVLAVIVVCTLCGMLGSMVVGNRMAFFSDAMAHCAFAGVALGYLSVLFTEANLVDQKSLADWVVPLVMVIFGSVVGVGM